MIAPSRRTVSPSSSTRSGTWRLIDENSASRVSTAVTWYPCSRRSHDRAPEMTGFSSAIRMWPRSPAEYCTKSVPLDVAAAQHRDGRASWYDLLLQQCRHGDRAARLDDQLHAVQEQAHRR